jgi:hypothetical protein
MLLASAATIWNPLEMGCNVEGRSGTVKAKGFVAELSDRAVCEREGKD